MNSQEFLEKENRALRERVIALLEKVRVLDTILLLTLRYKDADNFVTVATLFKNGTRYGEIDLKNGEVHAFVRDNEESIYNNHVRYTSLLEAYELLSKNYNIQFIL